MMMIEDLAHAAYEAAQQRDQEAMEAAVTDLLGRGRYDIDTAAQTWMDRTIVMIGHVLNGQIKLKIAMISDHSGTGIAEPLQQVMRPDVAWAGKMLMAYAHRDAAAWAGLWAVVPAGEIRWYVERLLTTMAFTGLAYEEGLGDDDEEGDQDDSELECPDPIHRWVAADRTAAGKRIAKAHLN